MGHPVLCVILLSLLLCFHGVQSLDLRERDALCNEDGCYVLYFQRKIFLEAWRSCRQQDGNLATIRNQEEAEMVRELFSKVELRSQHRGRANIWIGLQRQPRQCSPGRPLRGFSWVTGDQDTQFTNWLQEDVASTCSSPRCVVMPYTTGAHGQEDNLKWKDGPCSISMDGYLCKYNFRGMCKAIASDGGGNIFYITPFNLMSTILTHVPYGSAATVRCPAKDDQKVSCIPNEDGSVVWNRDPPFCSDTQKSSCDLDNGGCHQICIETKLHPICDCNEGFFLAEDRVSCFLPDPCDEAPCEFGCLAIEDSYRCTCPDGYMQAPDGRSCVDVDECLQSPCEHICVNAHGTFECRCRDGYIQDEEGACEDVDECLDDPCEHACENTLGSHICHCLLGFAPLQDNQSRCHDIDECLIEGTCEQMCVNSEGGYECYCEEGYNLQLDQFSCRPVGEDMITPKTTVWEAEHPEYTWHPALETRWKIPLNSDVETLPTDSIWTTEEEPETATPTESSPDVTNVGDLYPEQMVHNGFFPTTTPTPTPDYYEDESTMVPTEPPSSTALGGAWNWLWFSSTQTKPETQETPKSPFDFPGDYDSYDQDHDVTESYDEYFTVGPGQQTSTLFPEQPQGEEEVIRNGNNSSEQSHGTSWLLVGLLVPLCIFIVVMVVLGIIYCTRNTVKPQNKNTSDCYHWIAGAGDKAAADISGSGTKSHV